jgi:hypothetical protein
MKLYKIWKLGVSWFHNILHIFLFSIVLLISQQKYIKQYICSLPSILLYLHKIRMALHFLHNETTYCLHHEIMTETHCCHFHEEWCLNGMTTQVLILQEFISARFEVVFSISEQRCERFVMNMEIFIHQSVLLCDFFSLLLVGRLQHSHGLDNHWPLL